MVSGGESVIDNRLSEVMGRQRVNISELARRAGVSRNTVAKIYRGEAQRVDLLVLDGICDALGVGVGDFLVHRAATNEEER